MAKISTTLTWDPDGVGADVATHFDGEPSDILLMLSHIVLDYSRELKTDPEKLLLVMRLGIEKLNKAKCTHTTVDLSQFPERGGDK